jgi:hypothetical protein
MDLNTRRKDWYPADFKDKEGDLGRWSMIQAQERRRDLIEVWGSEWLCSRCVLRKRVNRDMKMRGRWKRCTAEASFFITFGFKSLGDPEDLKMVSGKSSGIDRSATHPIFAGLAERCSKPVSHR